jgi:hypothetical protein
MQLRGIGSFRNLLSDLKNGTAAILHLCHLFASVLKHSFHLERVCRILMRYNGREYLAMHSDTGQKTGGCGTMHATAKKEITKIFLFGFLLAPTKMRAMWPSRTLCQTLFVWRWVRGHQPATFLGVMKESHFPVGAQWHKII